MCLCVCTMEKQGVVETTTTTTGYCMHERVNKSSSCLLKLKAENWHKASQPASCSIVSLHGQPASQRLKRGKRDEIIGENSARREARKEARENNRQGRFTNNAGERKQWYRKLLKGKEEKKRLIIFQDIGSSSSNLSTWYYFSGKKPTAREFILVASVQLRENESQV